MQCCRLQHAMTMQMHLQSATHMQTPGASVHWYGKQVQHKRKLGHITITGSNNQEAQARLRLIDPKAANAMDAASDRYTDATSQQSQGKRALQ